MNDCANITNDNLLLSNLPGREWERLRLHMKAAVHCARAVLYRDSETIKHVHFLQDGYASLMLDLEDGFQVETSAIGREGVLGLPLLYEATMDIASAVVQTPTITLSIPAETFVSLLGELPTLQKRLLHYAGAVRAQGMHLAACNGRHSLVSRLARCLLGFDDRVNQDCIQITHDMLAAMLCTHRPSVSVAAGQLQQAGAIRCESGRLRINSRPKLEQLSCECYQLMHNAYSR